MSLNSRGCLSVSGRHGLKKIAALAADSLPLPGSERHRDTVLGEAIVVLPTCGEWGHERREVGGIKDPSGCMAGVDALAKRVPHLQEEEADGDDEVELLEVHDELCGVGVVVWEGAWQLDWI